MKNHRVVLHMHTLRGSSNAQMLNDSLGIGES